VGTQKNCFRFEHSWLGQKNLVISLFLLALIDVLARVKWLGEVEGYCFYGGATVSRSGQVFITCVIEKVLVLFILGNQDLRIWMKDHLGRWFLLVFKLKGFVLAVGSL